MENLLINEMDKNKGNNEDERRIVQTMLYGDNNDAANDNQKSVTTTTQMTNYSQAAAEQKQNNSGSKNIMMSRSATSENTKDLDFINVETMQNPSNLMVSSAANSILGSQPNVNRAESGIDVSSPLSQNMMLASNGAANVSVQDQQTAYDISDRHNRQKSNQYNVMMANNTTASTQNLKQSSGALVVTNGPPNSIFVNAGQYASQNAPSGHNIPIRNLAVQSNGGVPYINNNRGGGPSQQSSHNNNNVSSGLSQQQIQQQLYKTAKTQMYEKMIIQQQQADKKQLIYAQGGSASSSFNHTQLAAQQALSQQQHFLTAQLQQQQQPPQTASLLFPRIGNIRNDPTAVAGASLYKTSGGPQGNNNVNNLVVYQNNLQSPFLQTQKPTNNGLSNGLIVTSSNNYAGVKKKTVSPRNSNAPNSVYDGGQSKMLLMTDKNQQDEYSMGGMIMVNQGGEGSNDSKNRNRIKSNNQPILMKKDGIKAEEFSSGKPSYNTEKFGQHLLMNSDSHTALAAAKLQDEGANQNQPFLVGEMSIQNNNNGSGNNEYVKRMTSEEAANLYQHAITPSIMSSHSNKRQSHHHIQMFNNQNGGNQQAMIQSQIQVVEQPQSQYSHNFFSRRTVSNKESSVPVQGGKQPHSQPLNSHHNLQIQQYVANGGGNENFSATTNYQMFSPTTNGNGGVLQPSQQRGMLMVEGSHSSTAVINNGTSLGDPRMKFAVSVAGMRASHDNSPMKSHGGGYMGAVSNGNGPEQSSDSHQITVTGQSAEQQAVKIPVICGFHKRVLLLTSQITNQNGNQSSMALPLGPGGAPAGNAAQPSRESISKKIRNRNPNCNHNNNSVFYAPCYNNVKYDDSYKKKEEVLRKVFFKECAREDEKRTFNQNQYYPNSAGQGTSQMQPYATSLQQKSKDPFTYLKPIENFLIQTLFVDYDAQQALKQNPTLAPPPRVHNTGSSLFMELGLEQAIVAHKAFLLALIQSGKITYENMLKVLHEFKQSATEFDHECIYCKYSQYALRESTKVIRNSLKAMQQQQLQEEGGQEISSPINNNQNLYMSTQDVANLMGGQGGQEPRIEYLIRMFQSQLFKRSFINTSLMIIQRKMNEKLLQKQRLPPGVNGGPGGAQQPTVLDANGKPKKVVKAEKKGPSGPPMSSLDWIAAQIQKLAKNLSNPKDKDKYLEFKEKYYREFLMKINQSNNAIIPFPKSTFTPYKYYIGKGNNSILVRNCLKQRFWWSMGDFEEWDEYNFIWTQWKTNKIIAKIKTNSEVLAITDAAGGSTTTKSGISTKEGSDSMLSTDRDSNSSAETLLSTPTKRKRVATALQQNQQNSILPIKKNTSASKTNVVTKPGTTSATAATEDGKEKKETSHNVITYNHMENNFHLSNKKALYYNMKIYYESTGQDWCSVLPLTFHIKEGPSDKEFQRFMEVFKDFDSGKGNSNFDKLGKQIWIVKPGENTNRGCGIQVCRELQQIKEIISNTNINGQKRSYIIQKYIEKPLLYKNRKFDIRCYTLMTTVNGNLQGYWYNEGYLRTSSKDFNLKNVTNRLIHLTNDAVQKKSDDYGKFESGNKLSYPEFQKYLDSVDVKCNIIKDIVPQLKKMATETIKACSRKVDPHRRHNTFEIFGYDFMIDEELKPWLIEVNTNPCLELSAPYLSRLIPNMVENAVKIAIDPLFPPPPWPNAKKHMIPECIENNKFELVFNELTDSAELKSLPIDDIALNGIIEEEEMEDEGSENDDCNYD